MSSKFDNSLADMVKGFLTDDTIMNEKTRNQIIKALSINCHLTSCYALQVEKVIDIKGKDSKTSGFYIVLGGTRCGVKFFVNNDLMIVRKPNKNTVDIIAEYSLYNNNEFCETFWTRNF